VSFRGARWHGGVPAGWVFDKLYPGNDSQESCCSSPLHTLSTSPATLSLTGILAPLHAPRPHTPAPPPPTIGDPDGLHRGVLCEWWPCLPSLSLHASDPDVLHPRVLCSALPPPCHPGCSPPLTPPPHTHACPRPPTEKAQQVILMGCTECSECLSPPSLSTPPKSPFLPPLPLPASPTSPPLPVPPPSPASKRSEMPRNACPCPPPLTSH
jgi:hypothetical protein